MTPQVLENSDDEVFLIGNEILKMFQDDLMKSLETGLSKRWGLSWFSECSILDDDKREETKQDLQFILKQVLQKNNGNFRWAIAENLFAEQRLSRNQLDSLSNIQKSRNFWAHPDSSQMTLTHLRGLAKQILDFYGSPRGKLVDYCKFILLFDSSDNNALPRILANSVLFRRHVGKVDEIVQGLQQNKNFVARIAELEKQLEKSPKQNLELVGIIPGFENLKYENLQDTLKVLIHASQSLAYSVYHLNMLLGIEIMKVIGIADNLSINKETRLLMSDFNSPENLGVLSDKMNEIAECLKSSSAVPPENCDCMFCSIYPKATTGSLFNTETDLTTQIYFSVEKE
jgi:hypothetical protein